jgi:hypothetical protein
MATKFTATRVDGPVPGDLAATMFKKQECVHLGGHQFGEPGKNGWAECACGAVKITAVWNGTAWVDKP